MSTGYERLEQQKSRVVKCEFLHGDWLAVFPGRVGDDEVEGFIRSNDGPRLGGSAGDLSHVQSLCKSKKLGVCKGIGDGSGVQVCGNHAFGSGLQAAE